jgi:Methylamine utilisation protein MauE
VILAPLFAAVAGLLALAGALKLRAPARGAEAYPAPGPALGAGGARAVGVLELGLGAVALIAPGRLVAAIVAAAFAAFAAYSARLVAVGGGDCGCFGEEEDAGTLGPGHVALDLACAAIAVVAVIDPPRAIASLVGDAPLAGAALAAGVAAAVYALYLVYTVLPLAWRAYAGTARR